MTTQKIEYKLIKYFRQAFYVKQPETMLLKNSIRQKFSDVDHSKLEFRTIF